MSTPQYTTIRVWYDAVFSDLAVRFGPLGFELKRGSQSFRRAMHEDVIQGFHLNFGQYPREPRLSIILSAWVRHNRVESLVTGWRVDISPSAKSETATIGNELGLLDGGPTVTFDIEKDSDVTVRCEEMWELIRRVGLPYVERFSDLHTVLEALSSETSPYHRNLDSVRCHHLPVISALVDGPEAAIPLFQEWHRRLKEMNDPNAPDYPEFVKYVERELGITIPL